MIIRKLLNLIFLVSYDVFERHNRRMPSVHTTLKTCIWKWAQGSVIRSRWWWWAAASQSRIRWFSTSFTRSFSSRQSSWYWFLLVYRRFIVLISVNWLSHIIIFSIKVLLIILRRIQLILHCHPDFRWKVYWSIVRNVVCLIFRVNIVIHTISMIFSISFEATSVSVISVYIDWNDSFILLIAVKFIRCSFASVIFLFNSFALTLPLHKVLISCRSWEMTHWWYHDSIISIN